MLADCEDEQVALVDGLDDFLGPHGGAVDVGFIHPDAKSLFAQILHQANHLLLVLPRVTNENVRVQRGLFAFFDSLGKRLHLGIILEINAENIEFYSEIHTAVIERLIGKPDKFIKLYL